MIQIRQSTARIRIAVALALALLLALRLLNPAGFMPEFDHGAVTIVACPDGMVGGGMVAHHHDHNKAKAHQTCPYASAGGLGGLADDVPQLAVLLVLGLALLLGRPLEYLERQRRYFRPPLRGPPILA